MPTQPTYTYLSLHHALIALSLFSSRPHSPPTTVSENWSRRFSTSPQSDHAGILFGGNQLVVNGGLGSAGNILDTLALNIGVQLEV